MSLATLTKKGRAGMAKAIANMPLHFAWGSGDSSWDTDSKQSYLKQSLVNAVSLNNEIGRRAVTSVGYVTPDDNGEIVTYIGSTNNKEMEETRYRSVLEPTNFLYIRVNFDFSDASNQIIREIGVFFDTQIKKDIPVGTKYFTPSDLEDIGSLLVIQRLDPPIPRSPSIRQTFEFILAI